MYRLYDIDYISNIQEDFKLLKSITSTRLFDMALDLTLKKWYGHGETVFADWFKKIYCHEGWHGGRSFMASAAGIHVCAYMFLMLHLVCFYICMNIGIPGAANHNQAEESLWRALKRHLNIRATMEYFVAHSIPDMLRAIRLQYSHYVVTRQCNNQIHRIKNGHLHRDTLNNAYTLVIHASMYVCMYVLYDMYVCNFGYYIILNYIVYLFTRMMIGFIL